MVLQDKEGSILEAHQIKIVPVRPWRYAAMGGELMGDLLPSGQLGICKIRAYSKYSHRASHLVSIFCSGLHSG